MAKKHFGNHNSGASPKSQLTKTQTNPASLPCVSLRSLPNSCWRLRCAALKVCLYILKTLCVLRLVRANCEQKGGCKAYPCFEKTAMCGDNGYLMAYGLKYCERFSESCLFKELIWFPIEVLSLLDIYNLFDSAGKDFINCTTPCLVHQMQKYIVRNGIFKFTTTLKGFLTTDPHQWISWRASRVQFVGRCWALYYFNKKIYDS